MLWTTVPVGVFCSGSAFPGRMSAPGPESTVAPPRDPAGARMYGFAPPAQLDDGLLPTLARSARQAAALRLRVHLEHVDALDVDVEEFLDRLPDLRLVRVRVDAEGVIAVLDKAVALLRDHWREQNLGRM